jgi:hypothetical protein
VIDLQRALWRRSATPTPRGDTSRQGTTHRHHG